MNYDCGFTKGDNWFRYRTGGIQIHNNKSKYFILLKKEIDKKNSIARYNSDNRAIT